MVIFDRTELLPGMILHTRSHELYGIAIRSMLHSWGNHDAILIRSPSVNTAWYVGESIWPRARMVPLVEYEAYLNSTGRECRVYWPTKATVAAGMAAGLWWEQNVKGTWYDVRGVAWLAIKLSLTQIGMGRVAPRIRQWEWANWCTEGVERAWQIGAGRHVLLNEHPTPLTVEKREGDGVVENLSEFAIVGRYRRGGVSGQGAGGDRQPQGQMGHVSGGSA